MSGRVPPTVEIISRSLWGAEYGAGLPTKGAKLFVFVHHTAVSRPSASATPAEEVAEVRRIEKDHATNPELTGASPRIGYTFLIAPSGRVYEGTGWGRIGAHTAKRNSSGYGICFMMDGMKDAPSAAAVASFHALRLQGLAGGHLAPEYLVKGHRDVKATLCPGDQVYKAVVIPLRNAFPDFPLVIERKRAAEARPTLRRGSGGREAPKDLYEAVRELQRLLKMPDSQRTGFFGDITLAEVQKFQVWKGLKVDGVVGPKTWDALLSL